MARYTLTNAFTTLTGLSEGTLQNVSRNVPIEISSSTNKNTGVILNPGDKLQFTADSTIYARAAWENPSPTETVYLAYEPFKPKGERGDIYQFRGSVATYSDLPASPNVGDVYDIQTADAEHGILAGDNVAWNGTSWDKLAGIYQVMTGATPSTAGAAGLVPAPAAGQEAHILTGAASWELPYGFRKPSTAYAVGDIVYSPALPPGKKLVCVAAGTTGSGALTLASTDEGALTTDGSVTWAVDSLADGNYDAAHVCNIFRGAEIPFTWAELQAKKAAGDFTNLYIGDYKEITLTGGEKVVCEIAGMSPIANHIDFISKDCLKDYYVWNTTATNNGTEDEPSPWLSSDLYTTLNDASNGIYSKLPSDLKPYIIQKYARIETKYSSGGSVNANTGWDGKNIGYLWLPTEIEVFGHATWSEIGTGTGGSGVNQQYPIFRLNQSRIRKRKGKGGSLCEWWEMSVYKNNSTTICEVDSSGTATRYAANGDNFCVPLCFRI